MTNLRVAVLLVLLAAPGCEKPDDRPRLERQALAVQDHLDGRLDELMRRAEAIGRRGKRLQASGPDAAGAERTFRRALAAIDEHRRELAKATEDLRASARGVDELHRLIDALGERSDEGVREATSALAAVESWIANAERQAGPAPADGEAAPAPDAPGGEVDASGAPVR